MPRVDFYVLSDASPDARMRYACRLAEESAERGVRVYLLTASRIDSQRLDELLWTYNDRSFLPHEIYTGTPPSHERVMVMLGEAPAPDSHLGLLINLTESPPPDLERYERIAEIVEVDPERKRSARERYRRYRECGCALESRNV